MISHVHWQEVGDGTWILYEGKKELYRAVNTEAMEAIMDFSKSEYYHHIISINCGVDVVSEDGTKLKRKDTGWEYDFE